MQIRLSILIFFTGFTFGCATVSNIETRLAYLQGESIETVVAYYLGTPDKYVELPNTRIYSWVNSETLNLVLPDTTSSSGYSSSGDYVTTTNYGTKTSSSDLNCQITLITNRDGIIRSSEVEGDFISCGAFVKRVERIPQVRQAATNIRPNSSAELVEDPKELCVPSVITVCRP